MRARKEINIANIYQFNFYLDVFLSPLKPPTESSISPALIEAALYYIHVATPDDEAVLRAIEEEKRLNKTLNHRPAVPSTRVHRKPVPGLDTQHAEPKPPSIPRRPVSSDADKPFQSGAGNEYHQARNPGAPEIQSEESSDIQRIPTFSRKPLPPTPTDPESHIPPQAAPNSADLRMGNGRPRRDTQPVNPLGRREHLTPPTGPAVQREPHGRASWDGGRPSILPEQAPLQGLLPERTSRDQRNPPSFFQQGQRRSVEKAREPPPPFHLTLIRRDTTNGIQWNVGNITNCTSQSSPNVALDGTITIEILTLGYKKLAAEKMPFLAAERPNSPHAGAAEGSDVSLKFIRHLTLTSPQGYRQGGGVGGGGHQNNTSINSLPSLDQAATKDHPPSSSKPQRGRHYTFKSPWDGTCTFVTGANGRSLKCKHTIPTTNPSLAGLNLPNLTNSNDSDTPQPHHLNLQKLQSALEASAAATSQSSSPASMQGATATAAELRFNLPMFSTPQKNSHQNQSQNQYEKNTSIGNNHAHPTRAAKLRSHAEELAGRLDLSLGRERAGGGTFGRSAKLGKLIVEDEGLKMLDLVVAACMGVWWGVYDNLS